MHFIIQEVLITILKEPQRSSPWCLEGVESCVGKSLAKNDYVSLINNYFFLPEVKVTWGTA